MQAVLAAAKTHSWGSVLLLAFALLGLFVVALAYRSGWAAVAGVALGGSLVAAVVGFRKGGRGPSLR